MRNPIAEIDGRSIPDERGFADAVVQRCEPVVLRGLATDWPVVRAAATSAQALYDYLAPLASNAPLEIFVGDRSIGGRYYYAPDLTGFNFERRRMGFAEALRLIFGTIGADSAETAYLGSVPTADYLRGFAAENALPFLRAAIVPRIWLGHGSNVSCHYDTLDNVACVIAGRRRFTLYPPAAIADLYVGPIDHTMAGQPVSLAAAADPAERARYPRFDRARDKAITVELEAGDAIYMPKLWWHQVEGLSPLNGLVNYWWDATGSGPDAPYATLLLAMIAIAERPLPERQAWRAFFDHYVFREAGHPLAHLPPEKHGLLGPLQPTNYGRIRAAVMQMLRGR